MIAAILNCGSDFDMKVTMLMTDNDEMMMMIAMI